jgi:SAM-dependent MidA family methyltransferase
VSISYAPWLSAWAAAAYGEGGFWHTEAAENHFRTAATSTALLAAAISQLLCDHRHITDVVELGAGNGRLLTDLAARRPDLTLSGVDQRARPDMLPAQVDWRRDLWDVGTHRWTTGKAAELLAGLDRPTLVVCIEWLDDLPCPVASWADRRLRAIEVSCSGAERWGGALQPDESAWCRRWWPVGTRVEVGTTRDCAWADAVRQLGRVGGLALVVDYGHVRSQRPLAGSLASYHRGNQVRPAPSRDANLTAAVAIDSLAAAGERHGAVTLALLRQAEALDALLPPPAPADTLTALVARSEHAALVNRSVWGDQWWLLQRVPGRL